MLMLPNTCVTTSTYTCIGWQVLRRHIERVRSEGLTFALCLAWWYLILHNISYISSSRTTMYYYAIGSNFLAIHVACAYIVRISLYHIVLYISLYHIIIYIHTLLLRYIDGVGQGLHWARLRLEQILEHQRRLQQPNTCDVYIYEHPSPLRVAPPLLHCRVCMASICNASTTAGCARTASIYMQCQQEL